MAPLTLLQAIAMALFPLSQVVLSAPASVVERQSTTVPAYVTQYGKCPW